MDGDPDCARAVGNAPGDSLPDPPRGIRRELEAPSILKLVYGPHQADVTLLNSVEKRQPVVCVLLGDRHDQTKVGLD